MFSLIRAHDPNVLARFWNGWPAYLTGINSSTEARKNTIWRVVNSIAREVQLGHAEKASWWNFFGSKTRDALCPKTIYISTLDSPFEPTIAAAGGNRMYLSPLLLVDLPTHLKLDNPDDPKLDDMTYLQQLSDWVCLEIGLTKYHVTGREKGILRAFLKFKAEPAKFHAAFRALIGHELGHIHHHHAYRGFRSNGWGILAFLTTGISLAVGGGRVFAQTPAGTALASAVPLSAGIAPYAVAGVASVAIFGIYRKLWNIVQACWRSLAVEREADEFAVRRLKDGLKGFEIGVNVFTEALRELRQDPKQSWKNRIVHYLTLSPSGEPLPLFFTHRFFKTRLEHVKQLK